MAPKVTKLKPVALKLGTLFRYVEKIGSEREWRRCYGIVRHKDPNTLVILFDDPGRAVSLREGRPSIEEFYPCSREEVCRYLLGQIERWERESKKAQQKIVWCIEELANLPSRPIEPIAEKRTVLGKRTKRKK